MKEDQENQAFGPEESWPGVKAELDRHFRKKRFVVRMTVFSIAGILILGSVWISRSLFKPAAIENTNAVQVAVSPQQDLSSKTLTNETDLTNASGSPASGGISNTGTTEKRTDTAISQTKESSGTQGLSSTEERVRSSIHRSGSSSPLSSVQNVTKSEGGLPFVETEAEQSGNSIGVAVETSAVLTLPDNDRSENVVTQSKDRVDGGTLTLIVPISHRSLNTKDGNIALRQDRNFVPAGRQSREEIRWSANVYGGAHYFTKDIKGAPGPWLDRRNAEEKNVILPSMGVSVSAAIKKFSVTIGFEYSACGEKVEYSLLSLQDKIQQTGSWQTFLSSVTDIDTAYIYGNQYFLQNTIQRMDSNYVVVVDTITSQSYDAGISAANGINRFRYFEVPVELSYCHSFGKFGLGASVGISPAWLSSKKGNYLRKDLRGAESVETAGEMNQMIVNGRLSIDLCYKIHPRIQLSLRPQLKGNLQSVFSSSSGFQQKYRGSGVLFGVNYAFD
ncbi:MAG TPA: hypothetical protein PLU53_03675 [Bacteroidia bacterium]|nr:hypothetical protein [Bacteroidia bacterium]